MRITADEVTARYAIWPKLRPVIEAFPDVTIELITDYGLTDIVAERFDVGVRLGDTIDTDMVAMPIWPPLRMVTVASPAYLKRYGVPERPEDLMIHRCMNLRLPTHSGLYPWEFTSEGREFRVRVQGPLIMNSSVQILEACLAGVGLAQLADAHVHEHIESGALGEVLREWSETFPSLHIYYPKGRQQTAAFKVVLNALRSDDARV